MLFGVAGGMARFLDLDPSIVRIVWALLAIAGGAGILLYIVAAIVIPEPGPSGGVDGLRGRRRCQPPPRGSARRPGRGRPTATTGAAVRPGAIGRRRAP